MNVNGNNGSARDDAGGPRDASIPCRGNLLVDLNGHRAAGGRPADPVDNQERAVLMRAFTQANTGLTKARESLVDPGARLHEAFRAALDAVDAVERLVVGRKAAQARHAADVVRARHAKDGPESLRRDPVLWSRLAWVVLALNVGFDLPFIGEATAQVLSLDPNRPSYYLAYAAGFGLPVLQFAAGSWLARSCVRLRVRATRRTERELRRPRDARRHWLRLDGTRTENRRPDDLPWAAPFWPIVVNLVLIGMLAVTAYSRVQKSSWQSFGPLGDFMGVFVVISLSLATIASKVLAYNPFADSDKAARANVADVEKAVGQLVPEAGRRLHELSTSWHRLHTAVERATNDAHRVLNDACAALVEERAESGVAGNLDLPLRDYVWPAEKERSGAAPRLCLKRLDHEEALLGRYDTAPLEEHLQILVEELNTQYQPPQDDGSAPEPPPATTATPDA